MYSNDIVVKDTSFKVFFFFPYSLHCTTHLVSSFILVFERSILASTYFLISAENAKNN